MNPQTMMPAEPSNNDAVLGQVSGLFEYSGGGLNL